MRRENSIGEQGKTGEKISLRVLKDEEKIKTPYNYCRGRVFLCFIFFLVFAFSVAAPLMSLHQMICGRHLGYRFLFLFLWTQQ